MWLKTLPAPQVQAVEQTLVPSADVIARFKSALPGVYPRVVAYAILTVRRKRWSRNGTIPEGKEAEDLVHDAIRRVLDGRRHWEPDKVPDLELYLCGIVRSIAGDLARSPANRMDVLEETTKGDKFETLPPALVCTSTIESETTLIEENRELVDEIMAAASQDPVLEKIIQAAMDGSTKPREVSDATGLPVAQVYAGMKKIRRRLDSAAKRRAK